MKNIFTDHPHSIGETYLRHAFEALSISFRMTYTALAMIVHAVFPFFFVKTARKTVYDLHERFTKRLGALQAEPEKKEVTATRKGNDTR